MTNKFIFLLLFNVSQFNLLKGNQEESSEFEELVNEVYAKCDLSFQTLINNQANQKRYNSLNDQDKQNFRQRFIIRCFCGNQKEIDCSNNSLNLCGNCFN